MAYMAMINLRARVKSEEIHQLWTSNPDAPRVAQTTGGPTVGWYNVDENMWGGAKMI